MNRKAVDEYKIKNVFHKLNTGSVTKKECQISERFRKELRYRLKHKVNSRPVQACGERAYSPEWVIACLDID